MQVRLVNVSPMERTNSARIAPTFLPDIGATIVSLGFTQKLSGGIARIVGNDGAAASSQARRRIMVVDDEQDVSIIFKSGLERNGFAVDVFNDPFEALSHYKPDFYDLLLIDVRMPGISGFELFQRILKMDSKARACFVSAFEIHRDEIAKHLPDHAEDCIIKKPVSLKELVRIVNEEISSKL